jgi:hypothetical protein
MSISQLPNVPLVQLNNIQLLNPALASSSLSTDANGNVVSGGGSASNSCSITIRTNPGPSPGYLNVSSASTRCEFVKNGNLVNFVGQISFSLNSLPPTGAPADIIQYVFSIDGLNLSMLKFTGQEIGLPLNPVFYNSAIYTATEQEIPLALATGSFINLVNVASGATNNLGIVLEADLQACGLTTGPNYLLLISGFYFSQ